MRTIPVTIQLTVAATDDDTRSDERIAEDVGKTAILAPRWTLIDARPTTRSTYPEEGKRCVTSTS